MPNTLIISWPINSGKTTISTLLAEQLPDAAHIKGDEIRHFITHKTIEEALPLTLANIVSIAHNFLHTWFTPIIDLTLSLMDYEYISHHLTDKSGHIDAFILSPPRNTALQNRGNRELTDREKERIDYLYDHRYHDPWFWVRIDNSEQTAQETTNQIIQSIS